MIDFCTMLFIDSAKTHCYHVLSHLFVNVKFKDELLGHCGLLGTFWSTFDHFHMIIDLRMSLSMINIGFVKRNLFVAWDFLGQV